MSESIAALGYTMSDLGEDDIISFLEEIGVRDTARNRSRMERLFRQNADAQIIASRDTAQSIATTLESYRDLDDSVIQEQIGAIARGNADLTEEVLRAAFDAGDGGVDVIFSALEEKRRSDTEAAAAAQVAASDVTESTQETNNATARVAASNAAILTEQRASNVALNIVKEELGAIKGFVETALNREAELIVNLDGETITRAVITNSMGEAPVAVGGNIVLETRRT